MKNNSRITSRERGLLKGAIRRVFARSDLRRKVLDAQDIIHSDSSRPRVKKWSRCQVCKIAFPKYLAVVDHVMPVIAVTSSFEEQGMDVTTDRTWSEESNLQVICEQCHAVKTKAEREQRKLNKKGKAKK